MAIIMTIIFTVITFPYELILREKMRDLEKKSLRSLVVGRMEVSLIGKSYFDDISMIMLNGSEISVKSATVNATLNPLTLVIKRRLIADMNLEKISYSSGKAQLSGDMNGNVDMVLEDGTGVPEKGALKLLFENIVINLDAVRLPDSMGGFSLPPSIRLSAVNLDSVIENKKMIIKNLLVSGPDVRGTISGFILLMPIRDNSKLELTVSIDSESALLKEFKPLLKQFSDTMGNISFSLKGTLGRPHPEFSRGAGIPQQGGEEESSPMNGILELPR
jgi:hypothetical protein